ncbi:MAG TPA: GNAT family N-acetyltransferase [Candidatus Limiplasma sp.]|nr:GNAT family N-acetyltransferase [Candidatus Limiplasma sp.]HRX08064.1 GNAT family N-acetyltransferase [Candidatus Limiplasma sp.]
MLDIRDASVTSADAQLLLQELNQTLASITGASGEQSFSDADVADPRAVFVIAYVDGAACGCGALRPYDQNTAEIKRVYARPNSRGVGTAIVQALEEKARALGYTRLILETRKVNEKAVAFYQKLGYTVCPNFGKYVGRDEAVCLSKKILALR